jgi:N-acetylmuramoyl-L-alanine amidase
VRLIALLLTLGLAFAQYENRLLVGSSEFGAIYPGGGRVAYGPAQDIARVLGLGYLEASGKVYLSLGAKVAVFSISSQGYDALRYRNAYRWRAEAWVPVRELAKNLELYYRIDYGAPVIALNPARLLEMQRVDAGGGLRYIIRFDRDVQARVITPNRIALIGVNSVPDVAPDSPISFSQESWGAEIQLPESTQPSLLFLPRQLVIDYPGTAQRRVVLDPGHGGGDTGVSVSGLSEKDLVLSVAKRLEKLLKAKGLEVIMTRNRDTAVPLKARAQYASSTDIFISLHAVPGDRVQIYSYPEVQTLRLIEKGRDLFLKTPEAQQAVLGRYVAAPGAATQFANSISENLASAGVVANVSQDAVYVLSQSGAAAVLMESGIERLRTPQARDQIANALAQSVYAYLGLEQPAPGGTR